MKASLLNASPLTFFLQDSITNVSIKHAPNIVCYWYVESEYLSFLILFFILLNQEYWATRDENEIRKKPNCHRNISLRRDRKSEVDVINGYFGC